MSIPTAVAALTQEINRLWSDNQKTVAHAIKTGGYVPGSTQLPTIQTIIQKFSEQLGMLQTKPQTNSKHSFTPQGVGLGQSMVAKMIEFMSKMRTQIAQLATRNLQSPAEVHKAIAALPPEQQTLISYAMDTHSQLTALQAKVALPPPRPAYAAFGRRDDRIPREENRDTIGDADL